LPAQVEDGIDLTPLLTLIHSVEGLEELDEVWDPVVMFQQLTSEATAGG
jgi:hypothetical protein